jgi:hypothetical protein
MNQDGVGACSGVRRCPVQGLLHAPARDERLRPGNDQEIRRLLRLFGGPDFATMLLHRHQLALHARIKTAALREDIVFERNRRHARGFVLDNRPHHIDGVAVAIIAIGDNGQACGSPDLLNGVEVLRHGEEVRIRQGKLCGRDGKTAGPDGIKPGSLDEACAQGIMSSNGHHNSRAAQQVT